MSKYATLFRCRQTGDVVITSNHGLKDCIDEETGETIPGLMECYSKRVDKLSGSPLDVGSVETVDSILDEHLGFDLHEVQMTKKELATHLQQYCKITAESLDDPADQYSFEEAIPKFTQWLLKRTDRLKYYTTPSGLKCQYPTLVFQYDEFSDILPSHAFVFIQDGLVMDEEEVVVAE
eukprot:CAMPEP_0116024988 /NCGR_PEP_ID=MMETSP0321-20121206/12715_1 /TAXON_ID=163516 /ORGANISM="Leptocylindrus danicus var. danicus, Strain B650" /LENGTH=177 /DNA_ID=CAMNT_0003496965 /DNA_START=74 /DNA_END=610 /DNA_ORIENTATION=+